MRGRLMSLVCAGALLTGAVAPPALAQDAQGPERASLTIYGQNLALVEETRTLNLTRGRSRQVFPGVSATIRPETVSLAGNGVSVVEQNFDYDLLTPSALMTSAVGEEIGLVRINPGTGAEETVRARVLSANQGVVLQIGDRIEVLRDDGVPTRVIFDRVPPSLLPRPTLTVTVDAERGGATPTTLTYLTTGLTWRADYVARFDEANGRLDLNGWVTVTNQTGTTFTDANTRVVAGDLNLADGGGYNRGYGQPYGQPQPNRGNGMMGGGDGALADYYVYPLPEPVTVANAQTKQVGFVSASGVRAVKRYLVQLAGPITMGEPVAAQVAVLFSNAGDTGLGRALPAGIVRVYMDDANGEARFVGEDRISHSPGGSELAITTGSAFDVTLQSRIVSETRAGRQCGNRWGTRYEMEYVLRNARPQAETVVVRQGGLGRETTVVTESIQSRMADSRTLTWTVSVPANGETRLTATYDTGWC